MKYAMALAAFALLAVTAQAEARDQIRIVGSSTVFPFATAVAEQFGKGGKFKTPVVESTGTGGGLKLFCAGVGVEHPDIANASRKIKDSERADCKKNGIVEITEVKIGYDGVVFANSKKHGLMALSVKDVWLALAKQVPVGGKLVPNPNKTWKDVNSALPADTIQVLGPPPTSGTRDALAMLVLDKGCDQFDEIKAIADKDAKTKACDTIREDGAYIEAGENDNLIVQKLAADPTAIGIFGYSYLEQNADKIQGSTMDGVAPTYETISSLKYEVSRPLYFYVKNAHVGVIPGIKEYVAEFMSDKATGEDGYLADKGLVPLPKDEHDKWMQSALTFAPLTD